MPKPRTPPRYRCRFCGVTFSAWIPVPGEPDGALLLGHIRQSHPAELKPFLDQVHTDDDITPAILQAYEVVDGASEGWPRRGDRQGGVWRVGSARDRAACANLDGRRRRPGAWAVARDNDYLPPPDDPVRPRGFRPGLYPLDH